MAQYGLGNMLLGASRAVDKTINDSRTNEQYAQKQEDRQVRLADADYSRDRRNINDTRTDKKYDRSQIAYDTAEKSKNVMRSIGLNGDPSGLADLYKGIGVDVEIKPSKTNGKFIISSKNLDGSIDEKEKSIEELGIISSHFSDPNKIIEAGQKIQAAKTAQTNALALEAKKRAGMNSTEVIKGEYSLEGKRITAGAKAGKNKDTDPFFSRRGKMLYGSKIGDEFVIDGDKTHLFSKYPEVGSMLWATGEYKDKNAASNAAYDWLDENDKKATARAKAEAQKNGKGKDWINQKSRTILTDLLKAKSADIYGGSGQAAPQEKSTLTPEQYREKLIKAHPDAVNNPDKLNKSIKQQFSDWMGDAANLVGGESDVPNPSPGLASASGSVAPPVAPTQAPASGLDAVEQPQQSNQGQPVPQLGLAAADQAPIPEQIARPTLESTDVAMADTTQPPADNIPIDESLPKSANDVTDAISGGLSMVGEAFGKKRDNSMTSLASKMPKFSNDEGGVSAQKAYTKEVRNAAKMVKQRLRSRSGSLKGLTPSLIRLALNDESLIRTLSKKTKAIIRQYLNNNNDEKSQMLANK